MQDEIYDPAKRAREKEKSRQYDADDLVSGRVSAAELQQRNAFIPVQIARDAEIIEWKEFE